MLIWSIFLFSCQQQKKDVDQITTIAGGRCSLTKNGGNYFCIDFTSGSDSTTNSQICDNVYASQFANYSGSRSHSFLSGDANTCTTIINDNIVGKCTISSGVINYYDSHWSIGTAQSDCSSEPGTWQ